MTWGEFLLILIAVLLFTAAILLGCAYVYYEMERQKARRKAKRRKSAPQAPRKKPVNPKAAALSEASSQRLQLNMMAINAVRKLNDVASRNLDEDNWADFH